MTKQAGLFLFGVRREREEPETEMTPVSSGERGSILVWTAVSLAVLIAFAGLATDIPYLYVARHQLQTAADACALAAAYGLLVSTSQAVTDGKAFAARNLILGQSLTPAQVDVFVESSTGGGLPDRVRCVTYRDVIHANPMPLFLLPILQLFGQQRTTADVSATATYGIGGAGNAAGCVKPWSIADRWQDNNGNGQFNNGIDNYDPVTTGYQYPADNGLQIVLKAGSPQSAITPGFFYPVRFPPRNRGSPVPGGDAYRENIRTCLPRSFVAVGDVLAVETGNVKGPTLQGAANLVAQDPSAFWDTSCPTAGGCLNSPFGASSARLVRVPFFDPRTPVSQGQQDLTVGNIGGFFIEAVNANGDVTGRFTRVFGQGGAPGPGGGFLATVQMLQ